MYFDVALGESQKTATVLHDRPFDHLPELRELIIPFGDSGYLALYLHEANSDCMCVPAFRHQKEAGY